jgi:uncharacterized delta-60 repeat protein
LASIKFYILSGCCDNSTFQVQTSIPFVVGSVYNLETNKYSGCSEIVSIGYNSGVTTYILTSANTTSYASCAACTATNPCPPAPSPIPSSTPAPTATPTVTPTKTPTNTPTQTVTPTNTQTSTPTNTPTQTVTPSITTTQTPTQTVTPTITNTPTVTPTITNTPTVTPTITNTPTVTPTITTTKTPTPTPTPTKTPLPTPVCSPTPTLTPTITPTVTPSPSPNTGCTVNSYCLFTNYGNYKQYDGVYYNYGAYDGYSLFYAPEVQTPSYIYYNTGETRWCLSSCAGGVCLLYGKTPSTSVCPDFSSSMFGLLCPTPVPSPVVVCNTFDFSAVFDCADLPFVTPTPSPTPIPFSLRFSGTSGITIPNNNVASIYPLTIDVNGIGQPISHITLNLSGFSHNNIEYLGILLTDPSETRYSLILGGKSFSSSTSGEINVLITTSSSTVWNGIDGGSFINDAEAYQDLFFFPPNPYIFDIGDKTNTLLTFRDINPYDLNGTWSLYVQDFGSGETGYLSGASLDFGFGVPPAPTPTPTPTPTQKCFGKAVDVTGFTFNYPAATPAVTPTPSNLPKNCVVTGTTEFRTFQSVFSNNYNKQLTDCSNGSTYIISQPLPFNTGATFQAIIDGKTVCVTYSTEVVNAATNTLNTINSGNFFECRFCTVAPSPTPTPSMTVTPSVTPTFTPTPSTTPCVLDGIDYTFVVGKGFDSPTVIRDIQQISDGSYYIAGAFTDYNGHLMSGIFRVTQYGVYDNSFTTLSGFSGVSLVTSGPENITIQDDGKIICCGGFDTYSGITSDNIARLNTDGTLDTEFTTNIGSGPNLQTASAVVQSNGKIVVVGTFTSFNGNSCGRICRLNSDGSFDSTFNSGGVGFASFNPVDIFIYPDDSMIVTGAFASYNGTSASRIIKLTKDGGIDPSFTYGTGVGGNVLKSFVSSDGSIYIAGSALSSYNGSVITDLARILSDGTLDLTFTSNYGSGLSSGYPLDIKEDQNGNILICGNAVGTFSGQDFKGLVRLYPNGIIDTSLTLSEGFTGSVSALSVDSSNRIVAGGLFAQFNSQSYLGLVRLYPCQT